MIQIFDFTNDHYNERKAERENEERLDLVTGLRWFWSMVMILASLLLFVHGYVLLPCLIGIRELVGMGLTIWEMEEE